MQFGHSRISQRLLNREGKHHCVAFLLRTAGKTSEVSIITAWIPLISYASIITSKRAMDLKNCVATVNPRKQEVPDIPAYVAGELRADITTVANQGLHFVVRDINTIESSVFQEKD
jgi:hypothetical protein